MTHSEIHWAMTISSIIPIVEIFIMGYCFYRFAKPFIENSSKYPLSYKNHYQNRESKKRTWCVGIAYSLMMFLLYKIPLQFDTFTAHGIGVFAAFLSMCLIERRNYEQKIFIAVTFFSLRWFSLAMAEILYDNVYNFIVNTNYMRTHPNMSFIVYVIACLCYLILEFLFAVIGVWFILKNYKCKYDQMSKKELIVLIIPAFMGVVGYEIIWSYRYFYILELKKISNIYDVLSFFYYVIAIIMIVMVVVLYQSIKVSQEEKLQNKLLVTQMDNMKQHIEQVENLYQGIRSIKHDMTNHIITLERLYAKNKQKEAILYSTELKASLSEVSGNIITGNPVIDVILQEMQSRAEKEKIQFDVDFCYPTNSNINVFDVSIILNNALQNALENTQKDEKAYISIISYRRKNAYMIEIRNRFIGTLQWNRERELPMTSKVKLDKYGQSHGYGLLNIQKVAEKYSGDIAIDLKEDEFCLSILLMMEA